MGLKPKPDIDSITDDSNQVTSKQLWFDPSEAMTLSKQVAEPLPLPVNVAMLLRQ